MPCGIEMPKFRTVRINNLILFSVFVVDRGQTKQGEKIVAHLFSLHLCKPGKGVLDIGIQEEEFLFTSNV